MRYQKPSGLRTKQARQHKPKFIHQLLDIFVQSNRNLQVWNYVPYADTAIPGEWNDANEFHYRFQDCRYLLVFHNAEGIILKIELVSGKKLAEWDTTGTQTIKWQANVRRDFRNKISAKIIASLDEPIQSKFTKTCPQPVQSKFKYISQEDQNPQSPLVKEQPNLTYLFTHSELEQALGSLIGKKFNDLTTKQEREIGQILEKEIIKNLGYQHYQQTDTGDYPDLLHQLAEVKFQFKGTIDLGKHLPNNQSSIKADWNNWNITSREVRYVVVLIEQDEQNNFVVDSIVITSGADFTRYFTLCEGTNEKVQLQIPTSVMP